MRHRPINTPDSVGAAARRLYKYRERSAPHLGLRVAAGTPPPSPPHINPPHSINSHVNRGTRKPTTVAAATKCLVVLIGRGISASTELKNYLVSDIDVVDCVLNTTSTTHIRYVGLYN